MHSYLGTQMSQELRYYGLHAVAVCTIVNSCVKGVGVNKATPNRGLHRFHLNGYGGEDELGDRGSEHGVTTTSSSSVRGKTVLVQRMDSRRGWRKRRLAGIALF